MTELVTFGETPLEFAPRGRGRLETASELSLHAHGPESTTAIAASRLGTEATWFSKLPDTPLGRRVVTELHQHGIATDVVWTQGDRQGLSFRELGSTPRAGGSWHDRGGTAAATTTPGDVPMDLVQGADVVFVGMGTPTLSASAAESTQAILRAASGAGAVTAVDLDCPPDRRDAEGFDRLVEEIATDVDVLLARESDARTVSGSRGQPRELANGLVAAYDLEVVAITRGERGAIALHDAPGTNVIHEREAPAAEVVDPRGRHAAFVGGFLHRLVGDRDAEAALTWGLAAATTAGTIPGPLLSGPAGDVESAADRIRESSR